LMIIVFTDFFGLDGIKILHEPIHYMRHHRHLWVLLCH
jgi:hypothetical protein